MQLAGVESKERSVDYDRKVKENFGNGGTSEKEALQKYERIKKKGPKESEEYMGSFMNDNDKRRIKEAGYESIIEMIKEADAINIFGASAWEHYNCNILKRCSGN